MLPGHEDAEDRAVVAADAMQHRAFMHPAQPRGRQPLRRQDLERVGDQAVNIAERVMDMIELPAADLPVAQARLFPSSIGWCRRARVLVRAR